MHEIPSDPVVLICGESGVRLDRFLSGSASLSRARSAQLIEAGLVEVNGVIVTSKKALLNENDKIGFYLPEDRVIEAEPQEIPLDVVFEDDDLLVVNKPQGMVVHPAPGNPDKTLVNALLWHCKGRLSGINGDLRPGIVHRIDKDTSGLLVVAKSDRAHKGLAEMIKTHDFLRRYKAVLWGAPKEDEGTVRSAVGRSAKDRKKMASFPLGTPNTKEAVTHYRIIERFPRHSFAEMTLETGRTHQIRVQMQSIGCPVLGDPLYAPGRDPMGLSGQCLHAGEIGFRHPVTGEELHFTSPLPPYFEAVLAKLRGQT